VTAFANTEGALLALGIAALWLGAFGLLRLPNAFARLHCIGFAGAAGSFCFTTAVLIDRGGGPLGLKSLAVGILLLLTGAVATHATGRALRLRQEAREHG
jgi:multicomponent Na+:H+ antiporter subunit G